MRRENLAMGGAVGASLLVASCCVAPTLFLLFGVSVGALGALSGFEPYRPIFIVLGTLALSYAGWRVYRTESVDAHETCADGACAPDAPVRRRTQRLFILAVVVFVASIAYPYVLAAIL